jgi:hypothetical protein
MRDAMPVDAMPGCHASCPAASIYVCDVDALVQSGVIRRGRVLCIRLEHLPRGLAASSAGRLATFGLCCCCCMAAVCCCCCWLLPESRRTQTGHFQSVESAECQQQPAEPRDGPNVASLRQPSQKAVLYPHLVLLLLEQSGFSSIRCDASVCLKLGVGTAGWNRDYV